METVEKFFHSAWSKYNDNISDPEMQLFLNPDEMDLIESAMVEYARGVVIDYENWKKSHGVLWYANVASTTTAENLFKLYKIRYTMSDRYNSLTVALDRDIRDEDAEYIISAIKMIRGVNDVTGNIVDADSYVAERRALNLVQDKLYGLIKELNNTK